MKSHVIKDDCNEKKYEKLENMKNMRNLICMIFNLPVNKKLENSSMMVVFRTVFHENRKCYLQDFLDECLYNVYIFL